jgi:putative ABC transport system permease protein
MLYHHLKIALRALAKNKAIAGINIVGLSVGIACFTLFLIHVLDEFGFDQFHEKSDRLFVVYRQVGEINGSPAQNDITGPLPLGPALQTDLPDVTHFARLQDLGEVFMRTPKGVVMEEASYTDAAFFDMFSFPLLYDNGKIPLASPNDVVLTQKMANKLFGESNPVGKILEIKIEETFLPFVVCAVTENIPSNSSLNFGILLSFEKYIQTESGKENVTRWHRISSLTFVELRPGSGLTTDSDRMAQFYKKYYPEDEAQLRASGRWAKPEPPITFAFLPIGDWHFDPDFGDGDAKLAWILLGIGGIILIIACINFTTLAIGRSAGRAREIGVRKVVGASRNQLSRQFLAEAMLLSLCSTGLGVLLAKTLLPVFNDLTGKELAFSFNQFPELWGLIPALAILVGGLAGSYPAFVLSGFSPLETLKNKLKISGGNWFTQSLVTFQFVLSVGLMACTYIMLQQLDFLHAKNPGFNKENVVIVNAENTSDSEKILARFQQSLKDQPEILGVSGAELALGAKSGWSMSGFSYNGQDKQLYEYFIDAQYLPVMNIPLLTGRNFDPNLPQDPETSVIFNEAAVRYFGWTNESAIGQVISGYNSEDPSRNPVVIGVVRDYNFRSMHEQVKPMMFTNFKDYTPFQYFVRIAPGNPEPALERIRKAWAAAEPVLPFRFSFLDERLQKFYIADARMSKTIGIAGSIAVLLACLGLFGLAALSTVNRTKEIGIRKVLGASIAGITGLLAKDFIKLVVIAIVIATPLAYYFMEKWLSNFAYRIDIQWWMFALAGITAIIVAFLTVGFQSVKAALANPVKSLKNE